MSLQNLILTFAQKTYHSLPGMTTAVGISTGVSYAASRFTRFNISTPKEAALITIAAILANNASNIFYEKFPSKDKMNIASKITVLGLLNYGAARHFMPENTLKSSAAVAALAIASTLAFEFYVYDSEGYHSTDLTFDNLGNYIPREIYRNAPRTVAAAGTAWLTARFISKLGLDPKVTMLFTATASALYYGSKPIFNGFENSKNQNYPSRALSLLGLTWVSKDLLKLDLPLYKPFIKTLAVATACIALFDNIEPLTGSAISLANPSKANRNLSSRRDEMPPLSTMDDTSSQAPQSFSSRPNRTLPSFPPPPRTRMDDTSSF